jgi:hypothetical protein
MTEIYLKKVRPDTCPTCGNASKPDLLAEVFRELQWSETGVFAKSLRAMLEARGLEIRPKKK